MGLICWEKPKKVRSTEEHNNAFSSDCDVPGTYVPNMSQADKKNGRVKLPKLQRLLKWRYVKTLL